MNKAMMMDITSTGIEIDSEIRVIYEEENGKVIDIGQIDIFLVSKNENISSIQIEPSRHNQVLFDRIYELLQLEVADNLQTAAEHRMEANRDWRDWEKDYQGER